MIKITDNVPLHGTRCWMVIILLALIISTGVAGCGGGGGGSEPVTTPPTAQNFGTAVSQPSDDAPPGEIAFRRKFDAGLDRSFNHELDAMSGAQMASGGVAAADVDGDGDIDLYVVGGDTEANRLFENQGDGTFVDSTAARGLELTRWGSGPAFGDIDGDGDLDLFVGAVDSHPIHLLENRDGVFFDITTAAGLRMSAGNTVSATFADYDLDGYPDLFLSHWGADRRAGADTETLWRNTGNRTFMSVSIQSGIAAGLIERGTDWSYTPNLADIDGDGDGDLLMASDFMESQVFVNNGNGTFTKTTNREVIIDQSGMGSVVADLDNDGDMDWFVTSIYTWDLEGGEHYGNRLYRNDGTGTFTDSTPGIMENGGWGWAGCAGDFDNDGYLDVVHVNGWRDPVVVGSQFETDLVRFFHNTGNGLVFEERSVELGLVHRGQGRGIVCFDADRDGDLDLFITNNSSDHLVYFLNEGSNDHHYLTVRLEGAGRNHFGIGARIEVNTTDGTQVREVGARSNFVSHDPLEAHFGLADATTADVLVRWPGGEVTSLTDVAVDQLLTITEGTVPHNLSVAEGSGSGTYEAGDEVPVEATTPEQDYHFSHWSSEGGGTFADPKARATVFTMPGDSASITANFLPGTSPADEVSVSRRWNEVLLQAIRNDYARPTVHARNLFHIAAAGYDTWAAFDAVATPWLLSGSRAGVSCPQPELTTPDDVEAAREAALSYAAWRLIGHRFAASPGAGRIRRDAAALMSFLGYAADEDATAFPPGSPAALGHYVAECYIEFGLNDGANEQDSYANLAYQPANPALAPEQSGNPDIVDLNRWQPLVLTEFIDQAGNPSTNEPEFLSPEWGQVVPFALSQADLTVYEREGFEYLVYHDPGPPPAIDGILSDIYKWAFSLVSIWSAHLDPADGVVVDISPASLGNIDAYPSRFEDYPDFYDRFTASDPTQGYEFNPVTGVPYEPQEVPRGDYTRVLAEFWADGPDSETPPGHWFVILNEVNDHALLQRRFTGAGEVLGMLEWDVKAYFTLGGAMHDAAVTAWGIKGWYDYIRPISALRAMAGRGQGSDPELPSYHVDGIPLREDFIELVEAGDVLAGEADGNVGKIKLKAWRGPDFIGDPVNDVAGVAWILAENWWPYQRPSFVTPPFAGYISGHSTYSRAAAEVLTALTGDPFFPGGMSGFEIPAGEFLVFEDGPSVGMTLEWATYRDASDQCSLSRIWGGIHPPPDDIPGRLIGIEVGTDAFTLAREHFSGTITP